MKRVLNPFPILAVLGLLFFSASFTVAAYADTPDNIDRQATPLSSRLTPA